MRRNIFMSVTLAATMLSAFVCAVAQRTQPQQRQIEVSQETINQIRNRPVRVIARPFNIAIADILVDLTNQPDVDLRPKIKQFGIGIKNQGNRGTCSVFALTFLLDYMYVIWRLVSTPTVGSSMRWTWVIRSTAW